MTEKKRLKIAVGITGASGSIYAKALLEQLATCSDQLEACGVVWSNTAHQVWTQELPNVPKPEHFQSWGPMDFMSPIASGSAGYDALIICPCSAGTMGRIAQGISNDLITRAADVMLKERKKLILVLRETPLNAIQINNMRIVTEAGGIICPASPSFYSQPKNFDDLAKTVTSRVLSLAGIDYQSFKWGE